MNSTPPRIPVDQLAATLDPEIFAGFNAQEIIGVTECLGTRFRDFQPGQILAHEGEAAHAVGLVLEGSVQASTADAGGNRHLLEVVAPGQVYGEDLLWDSAGTTHRTITASESGTVMLIGMEKIMNPGGPLCSLRSRVVENLFRIMGAKSRRLHTHLGIITHKSLRARIVAFLTQQASDHGSRVFTLPLSRTELAEHLNVDRAALSRELSRMKSEGIVNFHRNSFQLLP